jgi:hypothetical protein
MIGVNFKVEQFRIFMEGVVPSQFVIHRFDAINTPAK